MTITLGRYTFDTSNETLTLQQNALDCEQIVTITNYYQESSGNSSATDLKYFLESSIDLGGYYLGRFEESRGITKAGTTPSNGNSTLAMRNCRKLYTNHAAVSSDLVNSYAWDTMLVSNTGHAVECFFT